MPEVIIEPIEEVYEEEDYDPIYESEGLFGSMSMNQVVDMY